MHRETSVGSLSLPTEQFSQASLSVCTKALHAMAEVLTVAQLKRLTEHRYKSNGRSILEPPFQVFWERVVTFVPLNWAPNCLTLAGLFIVMCASVALTVYSPSAKSSVPSWLLVIYAFSVFVYQTLDAIDGKQARRTKSSSPLGELFDHGCDSVVTSFSMVATAIAIQLGTHPGFMFFMSFTAMFMFYSYHWQAYCTGTLSFNKIDVTEAQVSMIIMFVCTAIFGHEIWNYKIPPFDMPLKCWFVILSCLPAAMALKETLYIVFVEGGGGKNQSTVANSSLLFPMFPISTVIFFAYWGYTHSPTQLFENSSCLYICTFGLVAAKITDRLVVAHMTRSEMNLLDSILVGPLLLCINQYFGLVQEHMVLWICLLYCALDLLKYSQSVCKQICDYLNISCFKISEYNPPPVDSAAPIQTKRGKLKASTPKGIVDLDQRARMGNGSGLRRVGDTKSSSSSEGSAKSSPAANVANGRGRRRGANRNH